ncbi:hypothetical protein GLOIN_2v1867698 [Rhizophagus clarus]|uniref:Ion transport domain-containing protein n=1 Tax=Rhizophagus clarus TaxID=94130 RepID=A0A8H3L8M3_9GLOM|nr:hypothetical protein GLOIN_2v1867698 [Rhizophagus clarus]
MVDTRCVKHYVALSTDGKQVAIFNPNELKLSVGKFESVENLTHYEPFKDSKNKHNVLSNTLMWSLSVSNELNGEILVALSRPGNSSKRPRKPHAFLGVQAGSFILKSKSPEVNKTEALDALEKGESNPATWIFSILNKEFVQTIDGTGGTVKFLVSSTSNSKVTQEVVIVHNYGITKTTIPLNYHQYTSTLFLLNKTFHNKLYDKNSFKLVDLYFPQTIIKQIGPSTKDNSFYRNVKRNYFFIKDCKLNTHLLECYDLEGTNNGELIKSFKVDSNKQYFKESSRYSYEYVKNNTIIEISTNEKLLAYYSGFNRNNVTLYLMENSLEICTKRFTNIQTIVHIQFICNDEKLLIIGEEAIEGKEVEHSEENEIRVKSSNKSLIIIWDLFSSNSEKESIKIIDDPLNLSCVFQHHRNFAYSDEKIIYIKDGIIKTLDLIDILKASENCDSLTLKSFNETQGDQPDHMIYEPWTELYPRISLYLKDIQLIIGTNSVQIWRKSRLEFIWIGYGKKIDIKSLSTGENEFLLEFILCNNLPAAAEKELLIKLHWPHNIPILKHACIALEYLHKYHHNDQISSTNKPLFDQLQIQVQNIVKNFIKEHPIIFKLSDIRYNIMGNLIRGNCVSIIKKILFINENSVNTSKLLRAMKAKMNNHLHFPRLYSWDSNSQKKSDLEVAIESIAGVHRKETLIVGYLLDYYSDNAMQDTGWMFTITQALPLLYDNHLDYYARELFYKPCFGAKQSRIDESLVSSFELRKGQYKRVHAINIQRGLLKKPNVRKSGFSGFKEKLVKVKMYLIQYLLDIRKHDPSVMTNLCMVPLPDFLVYPQGSPKVVNNDKYLIFRILKIIFWPREYIISKDSQCSPFLRVLARDNRETIFSNPSLAALVDYKWRTTQLYFLRHSLKYIFFALFFSFIMNIIDISNIIHVNDKFSLNVRKIVNFILQTLFFYLGYYLLATEYIQLKHKGFRRYASVYKFFDCVAVIVPVCLVISLDFFNPINLDLNSNGVPLRNYTVAISLTTLVMWIELLLLLRFFSGPANYINISLSIIRRVFYFFIFMFILIIAIAHSMYILLRSPKTINLEPNGQSYAILSSTSDAKNLYPDITISQTFDVDNVTDNYFSNFWESIMAVYFWINGRWDQVDQWNFLPVEILCFVASILLITVMQNMLIAFMTSVFDDARASGRQAVLKFRAELICDYETLEKAVSSRKNERNGYKENPRYLYYVAKVDEVEHWEEKGKKYRKMHKTILVDKSDVLTDDDDENVSSSNNKDRKLLLSDDSLNSENDGFCETVENKRIVNEVVKLEQKMNELQNGMKILDGKLEQIFQLLKSK